MFRVIGAGLVVLAVALVSLVESCGLRWHEVSRRGYALSVAFTGANAAEREGTYNDTI